MGNFLKSITNDKKGWVYIIKNPELRGVIKIGKSESDPIIRADKLSRATSSIGKFKKGWSKEVESINMAEAILHFAFREFHHEKEYFNIKMETAIPIAEKVIEEFFLGDKKLQVSFQFHKLTNTLEYELKNPNNYLEKMNEEEREIEERINYIK